MIAKSDFVKAINALHEQYVFDKQCADAMSKMFGSEISGVYNNSYLSNALLDLLRLSFPKDENGHCELEFYCYTLNFGKLGDEYESAENLYSRLTTEVINPSFDPINL